MRINFFNNWKFNRGLDKEMGYKYKDYFPLTTHIFRLGYCFTKYVKYIFISLLDFDLMIYFQDDL